MPERGIASKSMPIRSISQKMAKDHPRQEHILFFILAKDMFFRRNLI
jgi:hypothetical protein